MADDSALPPSALDQPPPQGQVTDHPVNVERFGNGSIRIARNYRRRADGRFHLHGRYTVYYPGGGKRAEVNYVENQRDGTLTTWYANGQIASRRHFRLGMEQGTYTVWSPGGQKIWEVKYLDGRPHGRFQGWHANGQLAQTGTCIAGCRHGLEQRWNRKGELVRVTRWRFGQIADGPPPQRPATGPSSTNPGQDDPPVPAPAPASTVRKTTLGDRPEQLSEAAQSQPRPRRSNPKPASDAEPTGR